jgi:lysophospholipase L1-like esterase
MARFCSLFMLLGLWLAGCQPARAQASAAPDSLHAAYPFLNLAANHIENATIGLQRFYQRLQQLPLHPARLPGGRVAIVHIGDSHLQADDYAGRVRQELQRTYGNAGRGLVFPYAVARTNGSPTYYTTATGGTWRAKRVTNLPDSSLPVGVAGITLATPDSGAGFTLRLPNPRVPLLHRPNNCFSQLTLLRQPGSAAFDWQVLSRHQELLGTLPGLGQGVAATLRLDSLRDFVALRATRRRPNQSTGLLYGLLLENDQPGILYHGIGVNGAAVRQYNRNPLFFEQLPLLHPDLIIVSLGTNDAFSPGRFTPVRFAGQLDTLVSGLRQRCPQAEILLVSPADSYRNRRDRNPDLARLAAVLRTYAQQHDLAYWDFATVQGGYGSMGQWRTSGLALNDFVHFSTKGYDLQGYLLYRALQDGFAAFLHQ